MPFATNPRHARSLCRPKGEGPPSDPIDISHECLLRQWTKLRDWVREEARDAAQFQRLADRADGGAGEPLRGRELDTYWEWWDRTKPTPEWASRYEVPADAGLSTRSRSYQAAKEYLFASRKTQVRSKRLQLAGAIAAGCLSLGVATWQIVQSLAAKNKTDAALLGVAALATQLSQAESSTGNSTELDKQIAQLARYAQTALAQTTTTQPGPITAAGTTPRIYPQYWTEDQKNSLQQIGAKLSESGCVLAPAQKVSVGPSDNVHKEQAGDAAKIVEALQSEDFNAKPLYIAGFDKVPMNQFELWQAKPPGGTQ